MDFRHKGISNKSYQIWADTIQKEVDAKLKWHEKNKRIKEKFPIDDGELSWRGQYERINFEDYMKKHKFRVPEIKQLPKKADYSGDVNEYLEKLGLKDEKSARVAPITMYDTPREEKDLIYAGISRDHEGRYKYLTERKKYKPEQKYPFPLTSSMDYGWRVYDEHDRLSARLTGDGESLSRSMSFNEFPSKHGIKNEIKNTFFRENGCLSDQWKDDIIKARAS